MDGLQLHQLKGVHLYLSGKRENIKRGSSNRIPKSGKNDLGGYFNGVFGLNIFLYSFPKYESTFQHHYNAF